MRSNMSGADPAKLWEFYLPLVEVEQAFKELKRDLSIRPIYHQNDERIEAHIFVAFMAYCPQVTLKKRLLWRRRDALLRRGGSSHYALSTSTISRVAGSTTRITSSSTTILKPRNTGSICTTCAGGS